MYVGTRRRLGEKHQFITFVKITNAGEYETREALRAGADYVTVLSVTDILTVKGCLRVAKEFGKTIVAELIHMLRHDGLAMPDIRGLGLPQSAARFIAAGLLVVVPMISGPGRAVARDATVWPCAAISGQRALNPSSQCHKVLT